MSTIIRTYAGDFVATCVNNETAIYMAEATIARTEREGKSHLGFKLYECDKSGKEAQTPFKEYAPVTSLEDCDFTVRTYNCLKRAGYTKSNDLLDLSWNGLLRIRNLGKMSATEIFEKIVELYGKHREPRPEPELPTLSAEDIAAIDEWATFDELYEGCEISPSPEEILDGAVLRSTIH
jgi:DNA-directed RNA polymerase alpha subunit